MDIQNDSRNDEKYCLPVFDPQEFESKVRFSLTAGVPVENVHFKYFPRFPRERST